jgi:putative YphP/YqiW family bacilliredoxin
MRDEITRLGVKELLTASQVDDALQSPGTTLVFVNSVCGCAASGARPGLALSLIQSKRPDNLVSVFADMEHDAVARVREYIGTREQSSPQIALLKNGRLVRLWARQEIEKRDASFLAQSLAEAFEQFC